MESEVITDGSEKVNKDNNSVNKDDHLIKNFNDKITLKDKRNSQNNEEARSSTTKGKDAAKKRERPQKQRNTKELESLGAKKLGATKIDKIPEAKTMNPNEIRKKLASEVESIELNLQEELKNAEKQQPTKNEPSDIPAELMSNLKFKDLFKPDGWESLDSNISDDKYKPVLNKLANTPESDSNAWGGWGSWGVSSLINTATAGVSTLTSHVSQGLSLLEETMGIPNPDDDVEIANSTEQKNESNGIKTISYNILKSTIEYKNN